MKAVVTAVVLFAALNAHAGDPSVRACGPHSEPFVSVSGFNPFNRNKPSPQQLENEAAEERFNNVNYFAQSLRTSPDFEALRDVLKTRNIDPLEAVLVNLSPQDGNRYEAIVITRDAEVFMFNTDMQTVSDWHSLTEFWQDNAYCREIDDGMRILAGATRW